MTQSGATELIATKKTKSRRRDWVLLPVVGLLTCCLVAGSAELLSRWFYPVNEVGFQNCFATGDSNGDAAVKPNSVCWEQMAESTWKIEYRFNGRGHRAGTELKPKPPGSYRIVLIGSSFTQGLFVPRGRTFAALLPDELSIETGRRVEVYNEATGGKFRGGPYPTQNSVQHFDRVLAAQPDLILWVITPDDITNAGSKGNVSAPNAGGLHEDSRSLAGAAKPQSFYSKVAASIVRGQFGERLKSRWEDSRTLVVLKHLLIANESQNDYIKSYLRNGDNANFLKTKPDLKWQIQLGYFNTELSEIVEHANHAGIPLAAVFMPNRPQAAMLSDGDWPPGYDPFKLENEIRDSIVNHGGCFIDVLGDYRNLPHPERGYFPVDGHPNAEGHAMISRFLANELTSGTVPELRASTPASIATEP